MIAGLLIECVHVAVFMLLIAIVVGPLIWWVDSAMDQKDNDSK